MRLRVHGVGEEDSKSEIRVLVQSLQAAEELGLTPWLHCLMALSAKHTFNTHPARLDWASATARSCASLSVSTSVSLRMCLFLALCLSASLSQSPATMCAVGIRGMT